MSHPDFEYLGPYRVERTLGRGGMGTVYKGVHAKTGETVAIKVIATGAANQPRFRRRFHAEVGTLQKLSHPNIVSLIGVGEERGLLFYTMEFVDGSSLHDHLREHTRLPWEDAVEVGIQTAAALKHAHDQGIIHRDLKPANLMVDKHGRLKLTDFGIAKLFGSKDMTAAGSVLGTADYMPPEQAEGKPVTIKSDLYSLGAVLYALLCGRPPFSGKSLPEVLYAVRYNPVPRLEDRVPEVPAALCELVHQLLNKDPSKRPPTALVVGNRLKALQQGLRRASSAGPTSSRTEEQGHAASRVGTELTSLDLSEVEDEELRLTNDEAQITQVRSGESLPLEDLGTHEQQTALAPNTGAAPLPGDEARTDLRSSKKEDAASKAAGSAPNQVHEPDLHVRPEEAELVGPSHYTPITQKGATSFTLSEPEEHDSNGFWLQLVSAAGIILLLLGSLGFAWWMLQPPSADELYETVMSAVDSGDDSELLAVKDEIEQFMSRFPDDQRSEELAVLSDDMELTRWTRILRRQAVRKGKGELSAMEQAFLDCMQTREQDWQLAQAKLSAFLDVFGVLKDLPPREQRLIELARYAAASTNSAMRDDECPAMAQLERVIRAAEESLGAEQLRAYYRDVLLLYADEPWASEQVNRIRNKLKAGL